MTEQPTSEAVVVLANIISDAAWYIDGVDRSAEATIAFLRDAIHRDGDDADAIREALGLHRRKEYGRGNGPVRGIVDGRRVVGEWQEV